MDANMFFGCLVDILTFGVHSRAQSFCTMATILNDEEIKKLIGTVIIDGAASSVKPNSYALRLGSTGEFLNCDKEFNLGGSKKGIKVQPGHSVALTAFEVIDFRHETVHKIYPNHDLHAFISPLTDLSREGIVAPTTQVDSGYHGTLNWTITNTSNVVRGFLYQEKLFRLTIFKLAPGETPANPYKGDYQEKKGYVRSERKGAPQGMRESEWEDSRMDGGPEMLLENLIKSGYPWNLLGQRLQLIGDQFATVTNEFGDIKKSIDDLNTDVEALGKDLPGKIEEILERRTAELHFSWSVAAWTWVGGIVGTILMIVTSDIALNFLKRNGYWIGAIILVLAIVVGIVNAMRSKKK
jgi:deoxycytidine triphosphate deaminase